MSSRTRHVAVLLLLAGLGCAESKEASVGEDYRIVPRENTPAIESVRLKVWTVDINCNRRSYVLRHRIQGDTAQLWIWKTGCDRHFIPVSASLFPEYFFIPPEVLQMKHIVLLAPGPTRYVLK
jgi:hypothetical protein